ncbi:MAG: hypothetical protein F4Z32_00540 [Gemmatimonadetes bacterium]|nr:hypothetical protein [Gemmatimonadota bacterium]
MSEGVVQQRDISGMMLRDQIPSGPHVPLGGNQFNFDLSRQYNNQFNIFLSIQRSGQLSLTPPKELETVTKQLEGIAKKLRAEADDDEGFLPSMRKRKNMPSSSVTAHALHRTHEILVGLSLAVVALRDLERNKYPT